jgi:WD40-like Beta Propeller Repeat
MGARAFVRAVAVLCLAGFSLVLWSSAASAAGECPNEARRKEQNARYLPDCRAYEMVSPVDKKGSDVNGANNTSQISDSGDRGTFEAFAGLGESHGSGIFGLTQYVTKRGESGWGTYVGVDPQPVKTDLQVVLGATTVPLFSKSLEKAYVEGYQMVGSTNPDLPSNLNAYLEDTETGVLEALTSPVGVDPSTIEPLAFNEPFGGASADLGVIAFQGRGDLMPGLPPGRKLYAWNHGTLKVVGVLPDGTLPAGGSGRANPSSGLGEDRVQDAVSADGSRVLFTSPADFSKPAQLYLRRNGESTAWVSQAESSTPNPEPEVIEYLDMSADGSKVLFGSQDPLTDSDPGGEGYGLYLYTDGPNPETEHNLTFIARASGGLGFGTSIKQFSGMSPDGKRIYFFSKANGALSQTGTYLWDAGTLRFVAPTAARLSTSVGDLETEAEVSADGSRLAFLYPGQLTEAPVGPKKVAMYLYDEASERLKCLSCLPSGAPTASSATTWPEADSVLPNNLLSRPGTFITQDGRYVFLSTTDALVPSDVNGVEDVYEYDAQTGEVSLLSSGTSGDGSWFTDASPDGSNVLFVSRGSYLRQDADRLIDVYDVRVDGGFLQPSPTTGGCVGDECQGVPSASPNFNTASGFTGLGNVVHSNAGSAKLKSLTRARKLKRALRACKRRHGRARRRCEAKVHKRYGAHKANKSSSHAAARG